MILVSIIVWILQLCGCIGAKLPNLQDQEEQLQERKIFNTTENLHEAQVAIEVNIYKLIFSICICFVIVLNVYFYFYLLALIMEDKKK